MKLPCSTFLCSNQFHTSPRTAVVSLSKNYSQLTHTHTKAHDSFGDGRPTTRDAVSAARKHVGRAYRRHRGRCRLQSADANGTLTITSGSFREIQSRDLNAVINPLSLLIFDRNFSLSIIICYLPTDFVSEVRKTDTYCHCGRRKGRCIGRPRNPKIIYHYRFILIVVLFPCCFRFCVRHRTDYIYLSSIYKRFIIFYHYYIVQKSHEVKYFTYSIL